MRFTMDNEMLWFLCLIRYSARAVIPRFQSTFKLDRYAQDFIEDINYSAFKAKKHKDGRGFHSLFPSLPLYCIKY